jgi:hypothetical protein
MPAIVMFGAAIHDDGIVSEMGIFMVEQSSRLLLNSDGLLFALRRFISGYCNRTSAIVNCENDLMFKFECLLLNNLDNSEYC